MKIVKSYQIPRGSVSPDIFNLPCVTSAYKSLSGSIRYHVGHIIAKAGDWVCRYDDGTWGVLSDDSYKAMTHGVKN